MFSTHGNYTGEKKFVDVMDYLRPCPRCEKMDKVVVKNLSFCNARYEVRFRFANEAEVEEKDGVKLAPDDKAADRGIGVYIAKPRSGDHNPSDGGYKSWNFGGRSPDHYKYNYLKVSCWNW